MSPLARRHSGFTLLELLTVIVILAILITMLMPMVEQLKAKAETMNCTSNLHSLYVAASGYVQDQGRWPQISTLLLRQDPRQYADAWIATLEPYKIGRENWVCPTVQRLSGNPDIHQLKNHRIDYLATPFDDNWSTPYRWSAQPWFAERGDVHGRGNLMIYSDGKVESLRDVRRRLQTGG